LRQSIALLSAGLAFRGGGSLRNEALARTAALISEVILPDGGAMDRSPKTLIDLLADLLPLRAAMEASRIAIPQGLNAAIERALPMLRMLCHGDQGLAVFHGVEQTRAEMVRAIFEQDEVRGQPLSQAPHSGYCRMEEGHSAVIVDCGAASICDSPLAFEFSDGPQRIAGSCGVPANASPDWLAAARSSAAHSTLQWDGTENGSRAAAELVSSSEGSLVKARNECSEFTHARELFLASSGHDFRGEDRLEGLNAPADFVIRFHLSPSIKASANRKGEAMLLLPSKDAWQFSVRGGAMALEESIYLAAPTGPRRCQQIVIRGNTEAGPKINWAFRKLERQPRRNDHTAASPPLPF
ncbi:MAG: heparinase II/III domain-containing protein, partial [Methylocella sp.]